MPYIPIQDLLARTDSIYKLVILASRRAAELNSGAPRLVEADSEKVSTIALEEIARGKVKIAKDKTKDKDAKA